VKHVASFLVGGLLAPYVLRGAFMIHETWCLFFVGGLLFGFGVSVCTKGETMSEGSNSVPQLMALLFSVKALVEYRANFVSDFDPMASRFGEQSFYYYFGVHGLCLIKNLTPLRVSSVKKKVQASERKCVILCSTMMSCL
jgi:heme/copper-type cytochrome/quinol oxidase subunit 3